MTLFYFISFKNYKKNLVGSTENIVCSEGLRLGHTRGTHEYIISGGHRQYCMNCVVPLTVLHILVKCTAHDTSRLRHLGATITLGNILNDNGPVQHEDRSKDF